MKTFLTSLISITTFLCVAQQQPANDTIRRTAIIEHKTVGNQIQFTPNAPTLNQIAGAPKAFYTNFWEFGDGTYSKENTPKKSYKKSD